MTISSKKNWKELKNILKNAIKDHQILLKNVELFHGNFQIPHTDQNILPGNVFKCIRLFFHLERKRVWRGLIETGKGTGFDRLPVIATHRGFTFSALGAVLSGEKNQSGLVLFQALCVELEALHGLVATTVIDGNADCPGHVFTNSGRLQVTNQVVVKSCSVIHNPINKVKYENWEKGIKKKRYKMELLERYCDKPNQSINQSIDQWIGSHHINQSIHRLTQHLTCKGSKWRENQFLRQTNRL